MALPVFLKVLNTANRWWAGAEGRLAAISIDTQRPLGPLPQPWRALAQGGENLETFLDNENLEKVKSIGPKYIRIDHIFDGFEVVAGSGNDLRFDWTRLDALVNKITAAGALPFLSLSYTPPSISRGDIVDEPNDYNDWAKVVQKTIEHYSGERGLSGIYYEVWNEPDLFGRWTMEGKKDYKRLYLYASRGAEKAVGVKDFKLGGPATTGLYQNWMDGFFPFILENRLRLDFFSWHRYDQDVSKYSQDVTAAGRWIESHPYFANVEKIVTEMGPDSKSGGTNDTKVGAAHLIAVIRELLYKIKFGFSFSVNGGWGVLDKPKGEALLMLGKLGEQRLGITGEGTWVSAIGALKDKTYQVLVVNYDPEKKHSEVVPISFINLIPGKFILKQTILGGKSFQVEVATSEAVLQKQLLLAPNDIILLELTPAGNTQISNSKPQ